MTPLFRKILGMNWVLVVTMYGLLVFGVFAIESAARHLPGPDGIDGGGFLPSATNCGSRLERWFTLERR